MGLKLSFLFAFSVGLACAADVNFNGKWDLLLLSANADKAWWLEVSGAGTPEIKGRFIGFPGGDLNDIKDLKIVDDELRFWFENSAGRREYFAKFTNGQLQGQMTGAGGPIPFTGYRAPVIRDHDDGTWLQAEPIRLFNGKDLAGWTGFGPAQELGWVVENGILKSTGKARNLVTTSKYWNYVLRVEYNVAQNSNSGIGLRGRYEVQILDDFGKPPQSHGNGALYSRIAPPVNASRKAGEWQTAEIRLVGRDVSITLNNKPLINKQKIEGLTAIAIDPFEGLPGVIELQGDHGAVEFRSIVLTPLYRPAAR
ncbi:MAG TPA: DUF1080 domain-containing protein [Bryobacteraceae bacterium]|nr:DUF1080 domain-containing protein [Bryobacteraceae bacterium]